MRYLTLWPRIGAASAAKAIAKIRDAQSVSGALLAAASQFPRRHDLLDPLNAVQQHFDSPAEAVKAASEAMDDLLKDRHDRWEKRRRDFKIIIGMAEHHRSVKAFLETYTLNPVSTSEAAGGDGDQATIITVHSAKGTEAPVCYLVKAEAGQYPHARSCDDPDKIEEERRILYVAITRAADELIITRAAGDNSWRPYEHPNAALAEQHYFLQSLPEDLIQPPEPRSPRVRPFGAGGPIQSYRAMFNPNF
jgi:DNA helicase-2/ATP-dependent DNA helicase PcrA